MIIKSNEQIISTNNQIQNTNLVQPTSLSGNYYRTTSPIKTFTGNQFDLNKNVTYSELGNLA